MDILRPSGPPPQQLRPPTPAAAATPGGFQVFLRLRPTGEQSSVSPAPFITTQTDVPHVFVTPPDRRGTRPIDKFSFTKVFEENSDQLDVFGEAVYPLLRDCLNGQDAMLATLGVTGSGKTHTILGDKHQKGMTQMALSVLYDNLEDQMINDTKIDFQASDNTDAIIMDVHQFQQRVNAALDIGTSKRSSFMQTPSLPSTSDITISPDPKSRYAILISMYELYNDRLFDLLDETPLLNPSTRRKPLSYKKTNSTWDTSTRKLVCGLRKIHAKTLHEALTVLEHGQSYRRVSATQSNHSSSRSHCFFQIELKRFSTRGTPKSSTFFQISDLAGSERARTAKTAGDRLVEAGSINRSLMFIGQCLLLLLKPTSTNPASICRQNKLTDLLFNNSFTSSNPQTLTMIATADPCGDYNATSQILRYTALAKDIALPRGVTPRSISSASSTTTASATTTTSSSRPSSPTSDSLIPRLLAQLEETESALRAVSDRCLFIEQSTREEVASQYESQITRLLQSERDAKAEEELARAGYVDEKIEILRRGSMGGGGGRYDGLILCGADSVVDSARMMELEDENARLRAEVMALKRELNSRSPCKKKVLKGSNRGNLVAAPQVLENAFGKLGL